MGIDEKAAANIMASQYLRIAQDSANLVNTTKNPEVFFPRLNLLIEKMEQLAAMENLVDFSGNSPSNNLAEIKRNRDKIIHDFLQRYYEDTKQKIESVKTPKAKHNHAERFKAKIEPYMYELSESNIEELNQMSAKLYAMSDTSDLVPKNNKSNAESPSGEGSEKIPQEVLNWPWYISISFSKSTSNNFERALFLAKDANYYLEDELYENKVYQAFYKSNPEDYQKFIQLFKIAGYWKSAFFTINGKPVDRRTVDTLNYCYGEKCRNGTIRFCTPNNPETQNPFGCDRVQLNSYTDSWWKFSHFDSVNYNLDKPAILEHIKTLATDYEYCPCFDWNNIYKAVSELPAVITKQEYEERTAENTFHVYADEPIEVKTPNIAKQITKPIITRCLELLLYLFLLSVPVFGWIALYVILKKKKKSKKD